jgi:hypothetical protein
MIMLLIRKRELEMGKYFIPDAPPEVQSDLVQRRYDALHTWGDDGIELREELDGEWVQFRSPIWSELSPEGAIALGGVGASVEHLPQLDYSEQPSV